MDAFDSYVFPFFIPGGMLAAFSFIILFLDAIKNSGLKRSNTESNV